MNISTPWQQSRGWLLAYGIILIILGIVAISAAAFTTLISIIFLGILLLIGGIVALYFSFQSWRDKLGPLILHFILALLFIIAGILLIVHPVVGAISVTAVLAVCYIIIGIFRIIAAFTIKLPFRGWRLLSGLIALILGILVLTYLPASGLLLLGILIGVDLLFYGWSYVILALSNKPALP